MADLASKDAADPTQELRYRRHDVQVLDPAGSDSI